MDKITHDPELMIPCGQCGHKTKQKISRLQKNPKLTCPRCGVVTDLNADQLRADFVDVGKALKKAGKSFSKVIKL